MTGEASERHHECPSWTKLARFVAEGGPWPAGHLRTCTRCNDRREFLERFATSELAGGRDSPSGSPCPDVTEVIAVVEGSIPARERMAIVEHLSACEACAALFRELVALSDSGELDGEVRDGPVSSDLYAPAEKRAGFSGRYPLLTRAAAVAVVAVALALVLLGPFPVIETGISERWRGPVSSMEATLAWPEGDRYPSVTAAAFPDADSYRIRVWDEDGAQLLERHRTANEPLAVSLELPDVPEGTSLFWQVDVLELGEVVATSGPRSMQWRTR